MTTLPPGGRMLLPTSCSSSWSRWTWKEGDDSVPLRGGDVNSVLFLASQTMKPWISIRVHYQHRKSPHCEHKGLTVKLYFEYRSSIRDSRETWRDHAKADSMLTKVSHGRNRVTIVLNEHLVQLGSSSLLGSCTISKTLMKELGDVGESQSSGSFDLEMCCWSKDGVGNNRRSAEGPARSSCLEPSWNARNITLSLKKTKSLCFVQSLPGITPRKIEKQGRPLESVIKSMIKNFGGPKEDSCRLGAEMTSSYTRMYRERHRTAV